MNWWPDFIEDTRHTVRWMLRNRTLSVTAIAALALGIGASTATFSVVSGVLIAPLPYPEQHRMVALHEIIDELPGGVSPANFSDWQRLTTSFSAMMPFGPRNEFTESVVIGDQGVRARVLWIGYGLHEVSGVMPVMGRPLVQEDHEPGASPAALVSEDFWRAQLRAAPLDEVTLEVDGMTYTLAGVMPTGFGFPQATDMWLPIERYPQATSRTAFNLLVAARLAPGASIADAQRELEHIRANVAALDPTYEGADVLVRSWHEAVTRRASRPLLTLFVASLLVLLTGCGNLAAALQSRTHERRRELAVRAACGAGRARIARHLLTESLILGCVGALAGIAAAHLFLRAALSVAPPNLPRLRDVGINDPVLAFAVLLGVVAALLAGAYPALRASRDTAPTHLMQPMSSTAGPEEVRGWHALIALQAAMVLVLLSSTGLMLRSLWNVLDAETGFDPRGVSIMAIDLSEEEYPTAESRHAFHEQLVTALGRVPGIQSVGLSMTLPLMNWDPNGRVEILEGGETVTAGYRLADENLLTALGMRMIRGRWISAGDRDDAEDVVVVNESLAARFPGGDAIGRQLRMAGMDLRGERTPTVVGVVADVRYAQLDQPPRPAVYLPHRQRPDRMGYAYAVIRSEPDVDVATAASSIVRRIDPRMPVEVVPLQERADRSLASRRFLLLVFSTFAVIAALLGGIGVYGVVASLVALRTRELGLRMALGATASRVVGAVAGRALLAVLAGVLVGVIVLALLAAPIRTLLFNVAPLDPVSIGAAGLMLLIIGLLAALAPARRAVRIQPADALSVD